MPSLRIGNGYDVHRLVEGRKLILGGVEVPFERGLLGHSDADVLLHALMDALLGAAGLPDIGQLFPDSDAAHKDADSVQLLAEVWVRVKGQGWGLNNLDLTLIAQQPKLAPFIPAMKERIALVLGVLKDQVGLKATTTEGLGFTGRGEGIAAQAVVLLQKEA